MPDTSTPIPNDPGFDWSTGSGASGLFGLRRVTTDDKIRTEDINQLRAYAEALSRHHHTYTDQRGC